MDILENTEEGKELKKLNRTKARTACILFLTSLYIIGSILFAIFNIDGYNKQKSTTLSFDNAACGSTSPCIVEHTFDNFGSPVYLYLNYKGFFTGFYIFSKSQSFGNIYEESLITSSDYCYPVSNTDEFVEALAAYGITKDYPPKIQAMIDGDINKDINPCGLKAALYSYIDKLAIKKDGVVVDYATDNLVNKKYMDKIKTSSDQWTNVKDHSFFSWLLPQPPITGTMFMIGKISAGLSGKHSFELTMNFPDLNGEVEKELIIKGGQYIFTNIILGIGSLVGAGFALVLFIVYLIAIRKK